MSGITQQGLTFTFYTVTDVDLAPVETELHSDVGGHIDIAKSQMVRESGMSKVYSVYMLIPDKVLQSLDNVMKVTDSKGNTYKMEHFEDLYTHQEIYLTKVA